MNHICRFRVQVLYMSFRIQEFFITGYDSSFHSNINFFAYPIEYVPHLIPHLILHSIPPYTPPRITHSIPRPLLLPISIISIKFETFTLSFHCT